jgi:hypothetical protein
MSHSTDHIYRESGEEAYDEADKGNPTESPSDKPSGIDRDHPSQRGSGRHERDRRVG